MSDRIESSQEPWQSIPHAVLRDKRLSPRAKGGLVTLLSHEAGWIRSCVGILQRECDCGRDQARAIMRELVDAGYARLEQGHGSGGRFTTAYTVSPHTGETDSSEAGSRGIPGTGPPPTVPPGAEFPSTVVEAPDVESPDVEALAKGKNPAHAALSEALLSADSRSMFLLGRLQTRVDEGWEKVTNGALLRFGQQYGAQAVIEALAECWEDGSIPAEAYPYLESICIRLTTEAVSA